MATSGAARIHTPLTDVTGSRPRAIPNDEGEKEAGGAVEATSAAEGEAFWEELHEVLANLVSYGCGIGWERPMRARIGRAGSEVAPT